MTCMPVCLTDSKPNLPVLFMVNPLSYQCGCVFDKEKGVIKIAIWVLVFEHKIYQIYLLLF